MNIKHRNLLTVTPIFFIIILIISILNYNNDKNEIMWKINEEAKSIAIGSSIFIENIIKNSSILNKKDEILMHLKRIKKYNQVDEFYITDKSNTIILTTEDNSNRKVIKQKDMELKDKNILLSKIYTDNNNSFINASTNIKKNSKSIAILTVKVNANSIIEHLKKSLLTLVITVIIITIVGFILSIIISNIVIKRIKTLKRVANSIAEGNYNQRGNLLDIKEFKDLENTLNTMKSIMQEILFKAKNSIIEQKQFSSSSDLGDIYSSIFLNSKIKLDSNIEIGIKKIGNIPVESLFNIVSNKNKLFLFKGEIKAQKKPIDSAIKASSANYYLSKKLKQSSSLAFINEFKKDFHIEKLSIIEIDKKSLNLNRYELSKKEINKSCIKIEKDKVIYFYTFNKEVDKELEVYIKNYKFLNIKEISDDLEILFKDRYNGLILLIKI